MPHAIALSICVCHRRGARRSLLSWRKAWRKSGGILVRPTETRMQSISVLETILERDRLLVLLGLVTVIALSWAYILLGAGLDMAAMDMAEHGSGMSSQQGMGEAMRMAYAAMMHPTVWTPAYAGLLCVMWWVMMVAMMLPSA